MKKEKIKISAKKVLAHNWFMIRIIFSVSPFYGIMLILNIIRWRAFNFLETVVVIAFVLESVEFGRSFQEVLRFLIVVLSLLAFSGLFSAVFNHVIQPACRLKIERKVKLMLYEKARDLDLSCYDDPYYYNEFVLSVSESTNAITRTEQLMERATHSIVIFVLYGGFFLARDPISAGFAAISFVVGFFLSGIFNKLGFRVRIAENPLIRKRNYIHRVFYLSDYAKELRLNKEAAKGLYSDFNEINDEIRQVRKSVAKKKWFIDFFNSYVFRDFLTDGLYLAYLSFKAVVKKTLSFSSLVVFYVSVNELRRGMEGVAELFPFAAENALYVEKIRTFLDYETKIISHKNRAIPNKLGIIRFEDVSFSYSVGGECVLKNINITINPLERVALVGYNGAGKTTLIKLLMRLYDPTDGRITIDGVDIRDFDIEEYRSGFGAIFQDYRIYAATVAENIVMDLDDDRNNEKLDQALVNSGFHSKLSELVDGVDTQLTREFDEKGTNLSGGESQKLAAARVFYKEAGANILDEPSSALDPISEYQLNKSMAKAAKEKSVIFISHRLSTTRHADKIYMLENGEIIEEGTHDELLKFGRKYSGMWEAQASKYVYK